jgi:microcystin-dependent protein
MSESYVGEIRMFGGTFAPVGWALCNGALIAISDNDTLYNLIGTTYGGNGTTNFALPNLMGRLPIHAGQGTGFQNYSLGETGGLEQVTLGINQLATHGHTLVASTDTANASGPGGNVLSGTVNTQPYLTAAGAEPLNSASLTSIGGSLPHDNMMPFLCINFIISLYGIYPSQG